MLLLVQLCQNCLTMPANKYALLRYRIIDRNLRNLGKPYPSKDDLRYACEEALYGSDGDHISMSTIDKDIWAMRNEGELGYYAPIKFSKEYGGYYYEDADYTIAEVPLNSDDLHAIRAAAETLYQFKDIPLFKQFDTAIDKIMDRMKISATDSNNEAQEVIQFERFSANRGSEFLQPLFRSCSEKRVVKIKYMKFKAEVASEYVFEPYILKEYRNRWYVIGRDARSEKTRTFGLDRIVKIEELPERRDKEMTFDAQHFFKHAIGITVTSESAEEVVLVFSETFAPYILTQPIHNSQKTKWLKSGELEVTICVQITVELVATILGYGREAKVVIPNELKQRVKQELSMCLEKYNL